MKKLRTATKIKLALGVIGLALVAGLLHYNLPRTQVLRIIGTDVKRVDGSIPAGNQESSGGVPSVRDVRFINGTSQQGKPRVFRNEDTGWGFPPYFKFNSADITAQAQTFAAAPDKPWVLVTYYGWRLRMFDSFPNVVSLKQVSQGYNHFPWFNLIFLTTLVGGLLFARYKLRKISHRIRGKFSCSRDQQEEKITHDAS